MHHDDVTDQHRQARDVVQHQLQHADDHDDGLVDVPAHLNTRGTGGLAVTVATTAPAG